MLLFAMGIAGAIGIYPFLFGKEPSPLYFKTMTGISWQDFIVGNDIIVSYAQESLQITGVFLRYGDIPDEAKLGWFSVRKQACDGITISHHSYCQPNTTP